MANYVPDGSAWIPHEQWADRTRAGRAAERRTAEHARQIFSPATAEPCRSGGRGPI
jgi:hypothetical protein